MPHPCLTERALVGKDLLGHFTALVQSGTFQLHLDSKTFLADTSIRFLQGDSSFGASPRTWFGCMEAFYQVLATSEASRDPLGCGRWLPVPECCYESSVGKATELSRVVTLETQSGGSLVY